MKSYWYYNEIFNFGSGTTMKSLWFALFFVSFSVMAKDCHVPYDDWMAWQDNVRSKKGSPSYQLTHHFMTTNDYRLNCRKETIMWYYHNFLQKRTAYAFKVQDEKRFAYMMQANNELRRFHQENHDRRHPPLHPLLKW